MPRGERIPPEVIGQIELMCTEEKSIAQICETLGVSKAVVSRVWNKMKEKSPAAVAAVTEEMEVKADALITDNSIITDTVENVKQVSACRHDEHDEIPDIVRETIAREIDNLANDLEILAERIEKVRTNKAELEKWYLGTAPHIRYREVHNE